MENRENIYKLAKVLNMIIEVEKGGVFIGTYKYVGDNLVKLKTNDNKLRANNREIDRRGTKVGSSNSKGA